MSITGCVRIALALIVGSPLGGAQLLARDPIVCEARTEMSSDGAWSLRIEPDAIDGQGGTRYRLMHGAQESWAAALPVFLSEVVVTKSGTVFGLGLVDSTPENRSGEWHVLAIASDGRVLRDELTPRTVGISSCIPSTEEIVGVMALKSLLPIEERDQCFVTFVDGAGERLGEEWRRYRLSTGEALDRIRPRARLANSERARWLVAAEAVAGVPLVLAQWFARNQGKTWGFVYALYDADANVVWQLDLLEDLSGMGDASDDTLTRVMKAPSGCLHALSDSHFEIEMCVEARSARYHVTRIENGPWIVREVEKPALASEPIVTVEAPAPRHVEPIGMIELTADDPPRSAVHNMFDFAIDGQGRIVFERYSEERDEFELVRVNSTGDLVGSCPLKRSEESSEHTLAINEVCCTRGDSVLVEWDQYSPAAAIREVSLVDGSSRDLGIKTRGIYQIELKPDGGFVVSDHEALMSFDRAGKLLWRRTEADKLCGGRDFAIDRDGNIALCDARESDTPAFQFISSDGKVGRYTQLVDVPEGLRSGPWMDPQGAWLMDSRAGLVRVDASGRCGKPIAVHGPDGRPLDRDRVRIAPDKTIWFSSDGSLYHLNAEFVVDRVLGDATDSVALRSAVNVQLGPDGRIYALKRMSGEVFVLDQAGKRTNVIRPEPKDFSNGLVWSFYSAGPWMRVDDDGSLTIGNEERGLVDFDRDGKRLGHRAWEDPSRNFKQAGTERRWRISNSVALVGSDGVVVRETSKNLDGKWLLPCAGGVPAADGSVALFIGGAPHKEQDLLLATFSRDGALERVIPVGDGFEGSLAWDGKKAAFLSDNGLHVVDVATGEHRQVAISPGGPKRHGYGTVLQTHGGRELWVFDGSSRVYRYGAP